MPHRWIARKKWYGEISALAKETPGVDHVIGFSGLSVQGFVNLSNAAVLFFPLEIVRGAQNQGFIGGRDRPSPE